MLWSNTARSQVHLTLLGSLHRPAPNKTAHAQHKGRDSPFSKKVTAMRAMLFYAFLPFVAYLGIKRPFWGLAIYLAANIIRPEMIFWGGNTGSVIFKVSIGSTLLGFFLQGQRFFEPWKTRDLWLMLWIWLAVMASLHFATIPLAPRAWDYAEEFLKMSLLAWLLLGLVKQKGEILKMADFTLLITSLLALWGWEQSFRGNERLEGLGGRAFGDSNGVAAFAVLFFPIALHKLLTATERRDKIFGMAATVLIGMLVVFTQSRGGFLGLAMGTFYLFYLTPKKKQLVLGMLLMVALASPFIANSYLERLSTIQADEETQDLSAGSRPVLWRAGWYIFQENPLFGVGLLNYKWAKMNHKETFRGSVDERLLDYTFQEYKVGHSTWFCQLLAEGGLVLTIPYLWLLFGFFLAARRLRAGLKVADEDKKLLYLLFGIEAGIFGHCVSISFIDSLLVIFLPVHLLLGMQIVRLLRQSAQKQPAPALAT
jgi:O-antigen ligase